MRKGYSFSDITKDEMAGEINVPKLMLTKKFVLGEKVKIARETEIDENGKEIIERERGLEFIVVQKYSDDTYLIAQGDFKHKLSANKIAKIVK